MNDKIGEIATREIRMADFAARKNGKATRQDAQRKTGASPTANRESERRAKKIEESLDHFNVGVRFAKYDGNKTAIVVFNKKTGEVIREIPPEEIQEMHINLQETAGLIFDRKV